MTNANIPQYAKYAADKYQGKMARVLKNPKLHVRSITAGIR